MSSPRLQHGREAIHGATYAITAVAAGRRATFADADAAEAVVDELRLAGRLGMATSLAWVVMPDHLHWMFELQGFSLAQVMGRAPRGMWPAEGSVSTDLFRAAIERLVAGGARARTRPALRLDCRRRRSKLRGASTGCQPNSEKRSDGERQPGCRFRLVDPAPRVH